MPPENSASAHNNKPINNPDTTHSFEATDAPKAKVLPISGSKLSPSPQKIIIKGFADLTKANHCKTSFEMGIVSDPEDSRLDHENYQCIISYVPSDVHKKSGYKPYICFAQFKLMKTQSDWDWLNSRIPKRGGYTTRRGPLSSVRYHFFPQNVALIFPQGVR